MNISVDYAVPLVAAIFGAFAYFIQRRDRRKLDEELKHEAEK